MVLFSFRPVTVELFVEVLRFATGLGVGNRKRPSKMKDWLVFQGFFNKFTRLLKSLPHIVLKKRNNNNSFACLSILWSILHHVSNTCFFFYLFIYLFFPMSLIANALKASRCVQIHAIQFSLFALRLCRIRGALLMPYYMQSVKSQNCYQFIKWII